MNIGVIGVGSLQFLNVHYQILKKSENINLIIGCDIDEEKSKKCLELGFNNCTTNYLDVISNSVVDLVFICVNSEVHEKYTNEALLYNKHVFVEKPPGINIKNMIENYQIANNKNLILTSGFNRVYYDCIQSIVKRYSIYPNSNQIVSIDAISFKNRTFINPKHNKNWLFETGIHSIHLMCFLMNKLPMKILTNSSNLGSKNNEKKNFNVILVFDDEKSCNFTFKSSCCITKQETYDIQTLYESHFIDLMKNSITSTNINQQNNENNIEPLINTYLNQINTIKNNFEQEVKNTKNDIYLWGIVSVFLVNLIEKDYSGFINYDKNLLSLFEDSQQPYSQNIELNKKIILINDPEYIKPYLHLIPNDLYKIININEITESNCKNVVATILTKFKKLPHLSHLPNLKINGLIGCSLKSFEHMGLINKNKLSVPIVNGSEAYANTVAEFIIMLCILGIRNASLSHELMRNKSWGITKLSNVKYNNDLRNNVRGGNKNFYNSKIGIIGYGFITKSLLKFLQPFNCEISIYSSFFNNDNNNKKLNINREKDLNTLVKNNDIIIINRGLSERTFQFFDKQLIREMRPGTILINTSKSQLIDMNYLIHRLKKNDIFACLDVFDNEPLEKESILRKLPNVFLTSHISGNNVEMYQESIKITVTKVIDYLSGNYVDGVINDEIQLLNMS